LKDKLIDVWLLVNEVSMPCR